MSANAEQIQPSPVESSPWQRLTSRAKSIVARVQSTRPLRVLKRFSDGTGPLLAAGMSYQALFAIFAAVWLVFAVAGIWLTSNRELLDALVQTINNAVPGLIGSDGAISVDALATVSGTLGWTGIIAAIGLLATAIGWLSSTREAIRRMFGVRNDPTNIVLQKLRDLGLAFGFGALLIVAALVSLVSTSVLDWIFAAAGIPLESVWANLAVQVVGFVVVVAVNAVALGAMYRVLSHLRIPFRFLAVGALIGSVALAVLSTLSGLVLSGASRNPLAASFAVVLGLLIWFNLACRVILLCSSWIAVGMADRGISARALTPAQQAVENQARRHAARIVLAEAEVEDARGALANASRFRRRRAARALARAERRLSTLRDESDEAVDGGAAGGGVGVTGGP